MTEPIISDCQIGFSPNKSTIDNTHKSKKYMKNIMNTA
jgi:hypothetical protein